MHLWTIFLLIGLILLGISTLVLYNGIVQKEMDSEDIVIYSIVFLIGLGFVVMGGGKKFRNYLWSR